MHVNLLYNLIIFFPFKCQMLDMVEKIYILQNTPPPPLQKK